MARNCKPEIRKRRILTGKPNTATAVLEMPFKALKKRYAVVSKLLFLVQKCNYPLNDGYNCQEHGYTYKSAYVGCKEGAQ